ncbi:helix-turn-helix transcriptional regulator [Paractinoplanes globisporus]|uniref:AAA family ATPase n=1 Tax=Paractinoplanes globisporus TaxID=113565 RepID=A0ABW6WEW3_9ACTN|nr:helix-turn-helix transcriptional regulator [Actinoplanes globisporus]
MRRRRLSPLVGRHAELAEVSAAWDDVCQGQAAGFLISGEAGVGKTRLVQECIERVLSQGGQILAGSSFRISSGGLPYGPILDALRRLLRDRDAESLAALAGPRFAILDQMFWPEHPEAYKTPDGDAGLRQARLFDLFLALLGQLAEEAPVLLVVEDVHWAEQSTLDLLSFLTVALRRERVLLLVTYRDDEPAAGPLPAALVELLRGVFMSHLPLAPLGTGDLGLLLTQLAGNPLPTVLVEEIADRSGGNAFFAEELFEARGLGGEVPARLRDVVLLRVAAFSPDARSVLRICSVVGRRIKYPLLAVVAELPETALLSALRELAANRVLQADAGDAYRFRHALAQEAVYSDLLPGERARLHARVATALAERPRLGDRPRSTATAVVAHHWEATGDLPKALAAVVAAGRAAVEVRAFREGLTYFTRALDLWDEVDDPAATGLTRPDLLAAAARCAHDAGEHETAVRLVEQALAATPRDDMVGRALLHEALGTYMDRVDGARALRAFTQAYHLLATSDALAERARVTAALANSLSIRGRYPDSAPLWEETLELARAAGCKREEVLGLKTSGWHFAMHGEPATGIRRMREALAVARDEDDIEAVCLTYNHLCLALDFIGWSADAVATAEEALRWSADLGLMFPPMIDMLDSIVLVLYRTGRWRQAEEVADRLLASHHAAARALMTYVVLAELATARGRPEEAAQQLKQAQEQLKHDEDPLDHGLVHAAAAANAMWLEDYETARSEVAAGLEMVGAHGDDQQAVALCVLGLRIEADEAERRRAGGRSGTDEVRLRAEHLRDRAASLWEGMGTRQRSFPEAAVDAAMGEAEFARLTGGEPSADVWGEVAAGWDRLARPYPAAYARWREAEELVRARDPRAVEVLREAGDTAERLEARALLREITALADRARLDLGAADAIPPTEPERPFRLTDRELQVLALLKEGRRNREIARTLFISESTASVHVSNILGKLNAANRVEAAAIAHRLHLA